VTTLKEVARRARVSTATVSKVISNKRYVSETTRKRVILAIEELGYVPNLAARALSKGRTHIIGVIFPYNYDHLFSDPFIMTLLEGIETACTEEGYSILINTPRVPVQESVQYQRLLQTGYLDGVITVESLPNAPVSHMAERYNSLWVAIGREAARGTANTVHADAYSGARAAAEHLIGLGHRRIGIIGVALETLEDAEVRLAGYRDAFEAAGLSFEAAPYVNGQFSMESGYQAAGVLLDHAPRPTALLCLNDRMAMGAIQRAAAMGLRIPQDVSIIGFDDIPNAAYFAPPLTTVRQPAREMGYTVARQLLTLIDRRGKCPPEDLPPIVFPTELVIRESACAPEIA
jgi:DNA-binding LacI/PurR family transcriptional regulator